MGAHVCLELIKTGLFSVYRDRAMLITDFLIATSIPFFIQYFIWRNIYSNGDAGLLFDYTLEETYIYFIAVLSLNRLNNVYDLIVRVSEHIRQGQLESFLIKPISYFYYNFLLFLGEGLLYYFPVILLAFIFSWVNESAMGALGFLLMAIISQMFCFLVGMVLSLVAFWLIRPDLILSLQVVLFGVFGGTLLPVTYWPSDIQFFMQYNPFRLMIGGPAEYLLRPSFGLLVELVGMFAVWSLIFVLIYRLLYVIGFKKYHGAGG